MINSSLSFPALSFQRLSEGVQNFLNSSEEKNDEKMIIIIVGGLLPDVCIVSHHSDPPDLACRGSQSSRYFHEVTEALS